MEGNLQAAAAARYRQGGALPAGVASAQAGDCALSTITLKCE
jgi:hypothetical protein